MTVSVVTPAALEPLTLAEAKAHLSIVADDWDAQITDWIAAARARVETFTRRSLITQSLAYRRAGFGGRVVIPVAPVQSVASITYLDTGGVERTLDAAEYRLLRDREPVEVRPVVTRVWPSTLIEEDTVTITVVAGYGASGSAVPADIRAALKMLVAHYFANREAVVAGTISGALPEGVAALLTPHILWI